MRIFLTWASAAVQTRISELLEKQKSNALTEAEESELMDYEEIDDYLSHVNRVIRNLSQSSEADLAASVLDALIERSGADPAQIEDVIMGCVMQAGEQSNNIARNAIMASKLPESVPGTSIDRQCGSSQQALHFAAQAVMSGSMDCVIAAGVESMTRVPMGLASSLPAKNGFGHYKSPNIEKRYPNIVFSQFTGAEMMAEKYGLSRNELDEFSYNSHQRAIAASVQPAQCAESARLELPRPCERRGAST